MGLYEKGCVDLLYYEVLKRTWPGVYCSSGASCKQSRRDIECFKLFYSEHAERMTADWMEGPLYWLQGLKGNVSPSLLVPGTAHLFGSGVLIALLRKEGWQAVFLCRHQVAEVSYGHYGVVAYDM